MWYVSILRSYSHGYIRLRVHICDSLQVVLKGAENIFLMYGNTRRRRLLGLGVRPVRV